MGSRMVSFLSLVQHDSDNKKTKARRGPILWHNELGCIFEGRPGKMAPGHGPILRGSMCPSFDGSFLWERVYPYSMPLCLLPSCEEVP